MTNLENKSPNILVIGDLIIDKYLWGSSNRISPEAPVQIIKINNETQMLGGAGNVVNNLKKLGANVDIISIIGNCITSIELKELLSEIKVDTSFLFNEKNRKSSKKTRIIASNQQVVRYDFESTFNINKNSIKLILDTFKKIVKNYSIVLLSDYGKGILTNELTQSLIRIAKQNDIKILIDPKGSDYSKYKGAYLLTPNKKEASRATDIDIKDKTSLKEAIIKLKSLCNLEKSIITLSEGGIGIYDEEFRIHPTLAKEVFDVTGAGDTVLASIGFAIACGEDIDAAVKFSNLAAGVVVEKIGSATASIDEIKQYETSINSSNYNKYIRGPDEIKLLISGLKAKDKKIVFTNGCFDLLHAGHIKFLQTAKSFGDILILGLNSDRSVTSIKGKDRPINNEKDRAFILSAIEVIDYLVIFDEDNPYELIKLILPNVLVKGGDYRGKKVIGEDIADELKFVDFVQGRSSTITIKKIRQIK